MIADFRFKSRYVESAVANGESIIVKLSEDRPYGTCRCIRVDRDDERKRWSVRAVGQYGDKTEIGSVDVTTNGEFNLVATDIENDTFLIRFFRLDGDIFGSIEF